MSPLVEIGLTDPPKSGGAAALLPPTLLHACFEYSFVLFVSKQSLFMNVSNVFRQRIGDIKKQEKI